MSVPSWKHCVLHLPTARTAVNDPTPLDVWVVDDDESIRWVLERALNRDGMHVQTFSGGVELLEALDEQTPDVLISDIRMTGIDGLDLMHRVHERLPNLPVIIITAHSDLDAAIASFKGGAFEYLPKPFDVDAVVRLVRRAALGRTTAPEAEPAAQFTGLVGEAPAMQEVFRAIGRLAASQITVLVTGESGTGKELVARALHQSSPRANGPFVAVNTAAIPKDLMESEFFGHERGAFTGAATQRRGRFEQADRGTLFLDEIGDMPLDLQTRLLRVLQDGQFYRVGGVVPIIVDVRVIAATHQDLEQLVMAGRFREDLYHRLNVIRIHVPPLRERTEDVPLLLKHFLATAAAELSSEPKRLHPNAIEQLRAYSWPGNVRQLENLCRWLTVMAPAQEVLPQDLPPEIGVINRLPPGEHQTATQIITPTDLASGWESQLREWVRARLQAGQTNLLAEAGPQFERALIEVGLEVCRGQRQMTARRLGWGRNTLTRKIRELGIKD